METRFWELEEKNKWGAGKALNVQRRLDGSFDMLWKQSFGSWQEVLGNCTWKA